MLLLTGSIFSDLGKIPSLGSSGSGITFPQYFCPFILVRLFPERVFLADRSGANTKQLSISHGGHQTIYGVSCRKWVWLHSHRISYDWQQLPCTRENCHTILRFKQGFDRRHSTMGKSLRFTIPYSKANNKSKSVW